MFFLLYFPLQASPTVFPRVPVSDEGLLDSPAGLVLGNGKT